MRREEDGRAQDAPSISLASEIVELVVLTPDLAFLQTLREAVGASRRLWHVASPDKVSDLLLAGGVGILVLDVQALLQQAAGPFISQIKLQFPDLVIVVAGTRETEAELARLISGGTIYRFIHKPMSPARAQLFADAAVKRYDEQRKRMSQGAGAGAKPARPATAWLAAACVTICAVGGVIWALSRGERVPTVPPPDAPLELPAAARSAPPAPVPTAPAASLGIAGAREQLLARATNALLEDRLDEAASAIEAARRAGADGGRLALLSGELAKARAQAKASARAKGSVATMSPSPVPRATPPARDIETPARATEALATAEHRDSPAIALPPAAPPEDVHPASSASEPLPATSRDAPSPAVAEASRLTLVKSVQPEYPKEARAASIVGWVELDFTVAASGQVKDISVHAASPRGVFERAAIGALSQWRYQPLSATDATLSRRGRVRIRFTLAR